MTPPQIARAVAFVGLNCLRERRVRLPSIGSQESWAIVSIWHNVPQPPPKSETETRPHTKKSLADC